MEEEKYRYFRCQCGHKTRVPTFAVRDIKSCSKCKKQFDNIVFDKSQSEIIEQEFYE